MTHRTGIPKSDTDRAACCLAHGIAHACDVFGRQQLATIIGTIALDLAALPDAAPASGALPRFQGDLTPESEQALPNELAAHRSV